MKQRDISIDILKCFAVIAITNSHMGLLYGRYSMLATGGAIGDCLFFFASGFTLFLGGVKRFDNYYKRRINRIYPTVFSWALISCIIFGRDWDMRQIIMYGGGWFVSCIMIYYVVLYLIRRCCFNHLMTAFVCTVAISFFLYIPFCQGDGWNMYGNTYYKWFAYFPFMLLGSIMGVRSQLRKLEVKNGWIEFIKLLGCVVVFYGLYAFRDVPGWNLVQSLSLFPLMGAIYQFYRWCNAEGMKILYNKKVTGWLIKTIGGLCLEVYIVQSSLFTDRLNNIFPLNLLIVFLAIIVAAYILHCLSHIWTQTFREADYDWKEVFKI